MGIFAKIFRKKQLQFETSKKQKSTQKSTQRESSKAKQNARRLAVSKDTDELVKALSDNKPSVRAAAAERLGILNNIDVLEPLLKALNDRSPFVRGAVAKSLGYFKDECAIEALIRTLKDGYDDVRLATVNALLKIGNPAVEPLIAALDDSSVFEVGIKTLKRIAPNWINTQRGKLYFSDLISRVKDENPSVRQATAKALGETGERQATNVLLATLKDEEWQVRSASAQALGKIKESTTVEPLILCLSDEDSRVRTAATDALGCLRDTRAINCLIACLKDEDWQVGFHAAAALKEIGNAVIEPLATFLSDSDPHIREYSARILRELGDKRGREALETIQRQDELKQKQTVGDLYFILTCLNCNGPMGKIDDWGMGMQGGSCICAHCGEQHNYRIVRGVLTLNRVSVPIGYVGPVEKIFQHHKE